MNPLKMISVVTSRNLKDVNWFYPPKVFKKVNRDLNVVKRPLKGCGLFRITVIIIYAKLIQLLNEIYLYDIQETAYIIRLIRLYILFRIQIFIAR